MLRDSGIVVGPWEEETIQARASFLENMCNDFILTFNLFFYQKKFNILINHLSAILFNTLSYITKNNFLALNLEIGMKNIFG